MSNVLWIRFAASKSVLTPALAPSAVGEQNARSTIIRAIVCVLLGFRAIPFWPAQRWVALQMLIAPQMSAVTLRLLGNVSRCALGSKIVPLKLSALPATMSRIADADLPPRGMASPLV